MKQNEERAKIKIAAVSLNCNWINREYELTPSGLSRMVQDISPDFHIHRVEIMKNDSTPKEEKCSLCEGTGVVDYENCPKCKILTAAKCDSTPSEGWATWKYRFEDKFPNVMQIVITDKPGHEDRNIKEKVMDFIRDEIAKARKDERRTIQQDIKSVLNFLDGDTPKEKIAIYIREYLEKK